MNSRQRHVLLVLSSICVGIMAFCDSFFVAFLIGAILIGSPEEYAFFSARDVILFLVSSLAGLIVAISAGRNYYCHHDS